jgi:hypothetical protein
MSIVKTWELFARSFAICVLRDGVKFFLSLYCGFAALSSFAWRLLNFPTLR